MILKCALAAVAAGDVASVLISQGPAQGVQARALTAKLQAKDVAVLIEGDCDLALAVKADGVLVAAADVAKAATRLSPDAITGARCNSRHDAMSAGEAGAQFIAFSGLGLIAWWADIFEIPAVSLIPGAIDTGAAFERPDDKMWQSPQIASTIVKASP